MKDFTTWLRQTYDIESDGLHVKAHSRKSGEIIGVWDEGGFVPPNVYTQFYYEEVEPDTVLHIPVPED